MNDITPPNPDENNQTVQAPIAPDTPPESIATVPTNKSSKKPLLIIVAVVLVAIAALAAFFLTKKQPQQNKQTAGNSQAAIPEASQPQAVEQVFISPVDGAKTEISKDDYYTVAVGDSEYYGKVSKINDDYIRMLPTAYKKSGALVFTGNELHGPEAVTYFKVAKVTKFQKLDPANKADTALIDALKSKSADTSDASPNQDINKYVKAGQFQAYFFADGMAFFAKTTGLDGTFLASASHVYVLQSSPQVQPNGTSNTGVSLVLAKPDQYNKRTAGDLLYWQNMKNDSQITKAATDFEKQNP